jgi:hypothetical protein
MKINNNLNSKAWSGAFCFECCGEKISFRFNDLKLKPKLLAVLPRISKVFECQSSENVISLIVNENKETNGLYYNNELAMEFEEFDDSLFEAIEDKIILILARASLPTKIFLHAGAIVFKNIGILIPGLSHTGKTTLVKEFIKDGAEYYTDDCIVLDKDGYLLPFPRPLAIRTDEGRIFREADFFGAKTGNKKKKLDLILFTKFEKNAIWQPKNVSQGNGILGLMDNFYYRGSVGNEPAEIIKTLTGITTKIQMFGGVRGEASEVISWFSETFIQSTKT